MELEPEVIKEHYRALWESLLPVYQNALLHFYDEADRGLSQYSRQAYGITTDSIAYLISRGFVGEEKRLVKTILGQEQMQYKLKITAPAYEFMKAIVSYDFYRY